MLPHRPLALYSQRFAVLIFFFNQLSNSIELFTFHSCTVILLSHSHPKHSEVEDRSLLDKHENRDEFHSWNGLTGNKLLVYACLRAWVWTRYVLWHEAESTAIHEKRLFPSFAIASTQAAFQTVWTLVLFAMPRNNKNRNFSSQPNSYFLLCFHSKGWTADKNT